MTHLTASVELSQLVIIDMQMKLASVMPKDAMQAVVKNCGILTQAANLLSVTTTLTEQYPQGLGATLPEITQYLTNSKTIEKTAFSAFIEPKFKQQLQRDKSTIILAGMEAHICIQQTALALQQVGKTVFVVEDAVISREPANKLNALARMRDAGCIITNTESVLFEWLGDAKHEAFKALSQLIKA
jgi:nicotinamidase-related amidase